MNPLELKLDPHRDRTKVQFWQGRKNELEQRIKKLKAGEIGHAQHRRLQKELDEAIDRLNQFDEVKNKQVRQQYGMFEKVVFETVGVKVGGRIRSEAARRVQGHEPRAVDPYPPDVMDALAEREESRQAVAKLRQVRRTLEDARLPLSGQLSLSEYDQREAFNKLVNQCLNSL